VGLGPHAAVAILGLSLGAVISDQTGYADYLTNFYLEIFNAAAIYGLGSAYGYGAHRVGLDIIDVFGDLITTVKGRIGDVEPKPEPDREACDKQYQADVGVCRKLRSPKARALCYASAMERYAACLKGDELPPLYKPSRKP